jgi:hypothetical protein
MESVRESCLLNLWSALEKNEEGIKILKYDMCIWVAYKWVNKENVEVRNDTGNPSLQNEI